MKKEPIPKLSDQRYFHVAVLSRRKGLSLSWVWDALERDARVDSGRLPSASNGTIRHESRIITESPIYAGSPEAVRALATSENAGTCDYDIIGFMTSELVMFGTSYSRLTHVLAGRLVRQRMMERGWFLRPKLVPLAQMFQRRPGSVAKRAAKLDVALQATGLTAFYRGSKNFKGFRVSGSDVFGEGFIEMISGWLESSSEKVDVETEMSEPPFGYKMMRVNATNRLTGGSASLTMRPDGSYKVWLHKGGGNLPEVPGAVSALNSLGLLEENAEVPKWAEEEEM